MYIILLFPYDSLKHSRLDEVHLHTFDVTILLPSEVNTWFKLSTIAGHFHFNISYKPTVNCSYYVCLAHSVTLKCPQSLEMIRLYLCKKCNLELDMTLCVDNWLYEEASLKKSGSSLLNSARKQWCQCLHNINIKFKCKKRIFPFNSYVLNFPGV